MCSIRGTTHVSDLRQEEQRTIRRYEEGAEESNLGLLGTGWNMQGEMSFAKIEERSELQV